jgi:phosphotriesterase-related protein
MNGMVRTVTGDIPAESLGITLIHEHLYTDLRPLRGRDEVPVPSADVLAANLPLLISARQAGITAMAECTPAGIGRTPDLYRRHSLESGVHIIAATGLYKEPLLPRIAYEWSVEKLADWMIAEIEIGMIRGTAGPAELDVPAPAVDAPKAGLIKLASSDSGLQEVEAKTLRAALKAAAATGAPIVSHSPNSAAALAQLDIIDAEGGDPSRFVVVHANAEPDFRRHLEIARRGAYLEYDSIGADSDDSMVTLVKRLLDAGYEYQTLLSQDVCGWIVEWPSSAHLANSRRFSYIVTDFLPKLRQAGVSNEKIQSMLLDNPRRLLAFAVPC